MHAPWVCNLAIQGLEVTIPSQNAYSVDTGQSPFGCFGVVSPYWRASALKVSDAEVPGK